jgi:glycosyltransferase involved in cell wall biosynthesis
MTNELKLQHDVIFKGHSDNIPAYLSAFDVFVLPSQREGCSRALLEAMSVGLPIIASNISEIKEVAMHGRNAVFVEYGDISQMAAAILELSEDKSLRERLGDENRGRVTGSFTMQTHVADIQQVYANLV